MTDLISRYEVVGKLKKAYFDKNLQEAKNDPCVIDAMTDWAIRQVKDTPSYSPWHTGIPSEEGDYLVAFRMSDNSVEYGWCNWNNGAWDILCDYDPTNGSCGMIAWQKIEPCNWFDFLFSEGHRDNWREVRKGEN